jgi:GAF domain-containing protein/anti-sigma regulatory factor (Ser/Thr protein kinase)
VNSPSVPLATQALPTAHLGVPAVPAVAWRKSVVFRMPPDLRSVGRARARLARLTRRWAADEELSRDAGIVLSELMSNGVLHARTELEVTVALLEDSSLRLEVRDASGAPVIPPLPVAEAEPGSLDEAALDEWGDDPFSYPAATGRGLAIVSALSRSWGWFPEGGGKVVWAQLAPAREAEPAAATFSERSSYPLRPVRLIAVPARLLKASEDHFDDLFRELQMAELGREERKAAPTGPSPLEVGSRLTQLADMVRPRVARMREPVRRALWEAAHRGDRLVDLNILADAGAPSVFDMSEELLSLAAKAARLGLLLTEPPPPEVISWRRWLRAEIEGQVRGQPPRACPFPAWPAAEEIAEAAMARLGADRLRAVRELRAALKPAGGTTEQAVKEALKALLGHVGGSRVMSCMLAPDNETVVLGPQVGYSGEVLDYWHEFPLSADLPAPEVIRTGRALVFRTFAELDERYPIFASTPSENDPALACLPLRPQGAARPIGALVVGFPQARGFSPGEMAFLGDLAQVIADFIADQRQLETRALVTERDRALEEAFALMSKASSPTELFRQLVAALVDHITDAASVHVAREDGKGQFLFARHRDKEREATVVSLLRRERVAQEGTDMVEECFRSGEPSVLQSVTDEALAASAADEEALQLMRSVGIGSVGVAPVTAGGVVAAVLSFANSRGKFLSEDDLAAVTRAAGEAGRLLGELRARGG